MIKNLLLLIIFIFAFADFSDAAEQNLPKFRIGYSLKTVYDVNVADAKAALEVWCKEIGEKDGFDVTSHFYEDVNLLINDMKTGKIDCGVFNSVDYLQVRKEIDFDRAFTRIRDGGKTEKFLLLVHEDSPYQDIVDLKGKKLSLLRWDEIGDLFLNTILLEEKQQTIFHFFSSIDQRDKPSQVLLSVFFKQSDACIVTDLSLKTMTELNPQVGKKLRVLKASPGIVMGFGFFRKDYTKEYKERIINSILNLNESVRGKQVLLLFKSDRFNEINESDMDSMKQLLLRNKKFASTIKQR
jgi:ABC-type phosphate/phosphonate transport system substrate-binding protein